MSIICIILTVNYFVMWVVIRIYRHVGVSVKTRWIITFAVVMAAVALLFPYSMARLLHGNEAWMGFLSGYSGSIFGGVFGGVFTFGAVYLTLNGQQNERYLSDFPSKMKIADDLMRTINGYRVHFPLSSYIQGVGQYKDENEGVSILRGYCREVVEQSIKLNFEMYQEARAIESQVASIISKNQVGLHPLSKFNVDDSGNYIGLLEESIENRRVMCVDVLTTLSGFHDTVFAYVNREYQRYDKLTGRR